jgi:hypothetical protein
MILDCNSKGVIYLILFKFYLKKMINKIYLNNN